MTKIVLMLHRRSDLTLEEFHGQRHGEHQALLVRLPGLLTRLKTLVVSEQDVPLPVAQ